MTKPDETILAKFRAMGSPDPSWAAGYSAGFTDGQSHTVVRNLDRVATATLIRALVQRARNEAPVLVTSARERLGQWVARWRSG